MAIVSDEYGYLFLQVPRTGCTAVAAKLATDLGGRGLPRHDIRGPDGRQRVDRKHCTLQDLLNHDLVAPEDVGVSRSWWRRLSRRHPDHRLHVIAAVRNPFDSLVSLYEKLRNKYVPLLDDPDSFIHDRPGMLADMQFLQDHAFPDWVERRLGDLHEDPTRHLYGRFLTPHVDSILRFEHLQEDFDEVMAGLGVEGDTQIPHVNPTEREADYRRYYDARSRQLVERSFQADLRRFGYTF